MKVAMQPFGLAALRLHLLAVVALSASCFLAADARAADEWPQFRGPDGQGHSPASGLPVSWNEKDNVAWKVSLPGKGFSSPVISGNQIWMTTATEEGHSLRAICVDRKTGRLLHNVEVFRPSSLLSINTKNSHASPTPVVEDGRLYVHFGSYGTACVDTSSAEVLWTNTAFRADHKEGPGSSPVLHGDLLLINCEGRDVRHVFALRKDNGQAAWSVRRSGEPHSNPEYNKSYSTPLVIGQGAGALSINPGAMRVVAYHPRTGKEAWLVRYNGFSNVPRPVFGNGLVYVCTGFARAKLLAIRTGGSGDVTDTHVAWSAASGAPRRSSPLLVGERIYMTDDRGVATCLNAKTGEQVWKTRLGGNYSASPLYADGRIYFSSEEGVTTVIAPEDAFRTLAANQIDGRHMASLAVAGTAIFLRSDTHLYRIEK